MPYMSSLENCYYNQVKIINRVLIFLLFPREIFFRVRNVKLITCH